MRKPAFPHIVIVLGSVLLLILGVRPAGAATITRNVDCGRGQTIAAALDFQPGFVSLQVIVEGVCNENVTITRDDVTLVRHASGGTVNGVNLDNDTITVNANRVTIDGLEVTGGNNGINAEGAGKLTIKNCNVHNTGRSGILIRGASKATIDNCTLQSNTRNGIAILGGGAATVTNSTISSNMRDGILIQQGGYGQIGINDGFDAVFGNTISDNGGSGINVSAGGHALIVANTISGNGTDPAQGRFGISVFQASAQIPGGNVITGNKSHGVSLNSANVAIGGSSVGSVVGLADVSISGNGTLVANSSGVFGFNGASINLTQTTISGTLNGGRGITLNLLSRLNTFGSNVVVSGNAGDGIGLFAGSAANFGPASVTGNTGFGLNCSGLEASFQGSVAGIAGNTAGQISGGCSGF